MHGIFLVVVGVEIHTVVDVSKPRSAVADVGQGVVEHVEEATIAVHPVGVAVGRIPDGDHALLGLRARLQGREVGGPQPARGVLRDGVENDLDGGIHLAFDDDFESVVGGGVVHFRSPLTGWRGVIRRRVVLR
jgi:hypothetical protein